MTLKDEKSKFVPLRHNDRPQTESTSIIGPRPPSRPSSNNKKKGKAEKRFTDSAAKKETLKLIRVESFVCELLEAEKQIFS